MYSGYPIRIALYDGIGGGSGHYKTVMPEDDTLNLPKLFLLKQGNYCSPF